MIGFSLTPPPEDPELPVVDPAEDEPEPEPVPPGQLALFGAPPTTPPALRIPLPRDRRGAGRCSPGDVIDWIEQCERAGRKVTIGDGVAELGLRDPSEFLRLRDS